MSRFQPDQAWRVDELFQMPGLLSMLEDQGGAKRDEAIRLAGQYNRTGSFQRSIQGELLRASNGRPFYRIWSDDPAALSIEFGTKSNAAHRILGRAIEKWGDVNTMNHPTKRKRTARKIEKSIDAWAARVIGGRAK